MLLKSFKSFHFSSEREAMGAVVKLMHVYRLYIKGASEILTKLCRWHIVEHHQGGPADRGDVELAEIDDFSEENITRTILFYTYQTLHTIALCYKDFASWLLPGIAPSVVNEVRVFGVAV